MRTACQNDSQYKITWGEMNLFTLGNTASHENFQHADNMDKFGKLIVLVACCITQCEQVHLLHVILYCYANRFGTHHSGFLYGACQTDSHGM